MKWYETPIEDLYEGALLALDRNDEDTYKENLIQRERTRRALAEVNAKLRE